mmetsp:Transcript_25658/g.58271  ORF Transcript_25658/g.58271 Transcript_25658/m.58271 type:complete len:223 (-) Transcript_25658:410-1078(-)
MLCNHLPAAAESVSMWPQRRGQLYIRPHRKGQQRTNPGCLLPDPRAGAHIGSTSGPTGAPRPSGRGRPVDCCSADLLDQGQHMLGGGKVQQDDPKAGPMCPRPAGSLHNPVPQCWRCDGGRAHKILPVHSHAAQGPSGGQHVLAGPKMLIHSKLRFVRVGEGPSLQESRRPKQGPPIQRPWDPSQVGGQNKLSGQLADRDSQRLGPTLQLAVGQLAPEGGWV